MKNGKARRWKGDSPQIRDSPVVGRSEFFCGVRLGAAMNAILHFPPNLSAELLQLRCEVAAHRQAIETHAAALEQSRAVWASQESDVTRRMNALRQRLASLLA